MTFTSRFFLHAENSVPAFEKSLSICIQPHGFSFSILDKKNKLYTIADIDICFSDSLAEIIAVVKQVFSSLNIPISGYYSTELIYPTSKNIWIPEHLFSKGHEKEYLQSVCEVLSSEGCYSLFIEPLKAFSVTAFPNSLVSGFKIAIPSIQAKSQFPKIIELPCIQNHKSGVKIAVNIRDLELDLVVFDADKLVFSNSFPYTEQEDMIYHVLNTVKQLQYSESRVSLHFIGDILPDTYNRFRDFFPHISLEKLDEVLLPNEQFYTIPRHQYALILC